MFFRPSKQIIYYFLPTTGMSFKTVGAASDGALNSMTLPLSRDLSSVNIRVNTIAPGYFKFVVFNV